MEKKGQGALEYLLLIGGAILVAVIVISILIGLTGSSGKEAEMAAIDAMCVKYQGAAVDADCVDAPDMLTSGDSICGAAGAVPTARACITLGSGRCGVNRGNPAGTC